jgi:hypothetical protein
MKANAAVIALACVGVLVISGCSTTATPYGLSVDHVEALKKAGVSPAAVGKFSTPDAINSISLRGGTMKSPVGGSYGAYLADAISQELALAKLLDPKSGTEISGDLQKNDVDVSGFITGTAVLEARIIVRKPGQVRFDKVKSASLEFDSNFIGAIAIPRGKDNYPVVVQKFLTELYADPDFIAALKQ